VSIDRFNLLVGEPVPKQFAANGKYCDADVAERLEEHVHELERCLVHLQEVLDSHHIPGGGEERDPLEERIGYLLKRVRERDDHLRHALARAENAERDTKTAHASLQEQQVAWKRDHDQLQAKVKGETERADNGQHELQRRLKLCHQQAQRIDQLERIIAHSRALQQGPVHVEVELSPEEKEVIEKISGAAPGSVVPLTQREASVLDQHRNNPAYRRQRILDAINGKLDRHEVSLTITERRALALAVAAGIEEAFRPCTHEHVPYDQKICSCGHAFTSDEIDARWRKARKA
jgi:chromosome segregation ATPase